MSTSSTNLPTADQLAASRLRQWHQSGEALLTFENLRSWINATGLVLFSSRSQQLPAPAPTLVEAVLGAPNANPVLADTDQARILLARLITEGIAVPLNLLGTPGETPDFVVSAPVFAYIFTLRGDKAWKQPPSTSGALKVSPLALATYTLLSERITMSAYDLATQLGKEVTESAVLRSLNELWAHLRVLPIPQADGAATLWELTSGRFTKLMKAGANAGQPSALSALISLYLNTAIVASEEEIETFLSPLAARSRIRDVVHALMGARQLETIAVEGRTVLHVAGELPGFLAPEGSILIDAEASAELATEAEPLSEGEEPAADGDAPRIQKFIAKPRKIGTGFVKKFTPKPAFGARPAFGGPDRERRPFKRDDKPAFGKPSFSKPWEEERAARPAAQPSVEGEAADAPEARPFTPKPRFDRGGDRPSYGKRPGFGAKPSFGGKPSFGSRPSFGRDREGGNDRPARTGYAGKPSFSRDGGESRPPRRDFGDSRPPRREFTPRPGQDSDRPSFGGPRKPGSFSARPQGQGGFGDRKPFGERKPFTPREGGAPRFGGKPAGGTDRRARTDGPPFRKFDAPRGDRPARPFNSDRPARPSFGGDRPARPYNSDRPARPSFGGDRPARPYNSDRPARPSFGGGDRPARPFNSDRPARPAGGGFAGKPKGSFGGKKPFGKPAGKFSGKPTSTFDKFKGNAKPFGNRPPARKYRPDEGESKG